MDPTLPGNALTFFRPEGLPIAVVTLVIAAICVGALRRGAAALGRRQPARRLLFLRVATFAGFGLYVVAGWFAVTRVFDLSQNALFAVAGTLAVAAGFVLRDVAADVVAGFSILLNRPFQVGDRIACAGYYGEVQEIGLRAVRLVTLDDNLVSVPTHKVLSEAVASANAGRLSCMVVIPFFLSPSADLELARGVVRDAVLSSRFLSVGEPIQILLSSRLHERIGVVVEILAKAYVYDAHYEREFASDVTERTLRAFRAQGVPTGEV